MKRWLPSNIGAEPKKLAILGGLVLVLGVVYWTSRPQEAALSATALPPRPGIPEVTLPPPRAPLVAAPSPARRAAPGGSVRTIEDFRPSLKLPEGLDVSSIDPNIRLDLLARVRTNDESGGARSLFEFSQAPAPPPPKVKPIIPAAPAKVEPSKPAAPAEPPKPPPPPPISLKYYGYAGTAQNGQRRAFFLDGEDIFVAGENELVRNRYRIVRIGVNSAVVEDTTSRNQQTLPLVEENAA